jgi:hypothetical protein
MPVKVDTHGALAKARDYYFKAIGDLHRCVFFMFDYIYECFTVNMCLMEKHVLMDANWMNSVTLHVRYVHFAIFFTNSITQLFRR